MLTSIKKTFFLSIFILIFLNACGAGGDDSSLEYIPADTVFYMGSKDNFPIKEALLWSKNRLSLPDSYYDQFKIEPEAGATSNEKFFASLTEAFFNIYFHPETLDTQWGIAENNKIVLYTLGVSPVLKLSLSNKDLFEKQIKILEEKAGLSSQLTQLDKASYRRYSIEDGQNKGNSIDFIIGYKSNNVIMTIDINSDDKERLAIALGQKKPLKSLASSGQVEQTVEKYQFGQNSLFGFVNHKEIANALTSSDANRLAKEITYLKQKSQQGSQKGPLDSLSSAECRKDILAIVDNWPRTVFGYTQFDLKSNPEKLEFMTIVEMQDQKLLKGLQSINGYIPNYVSADNDKVFAMGIGFEISNLLPFLTQQLAVIKKQKYQCKELQKMQSEFVAKADLTALSMATVMLNGVKGVSLSLNKLELETLSPQGMPSFKNLDAIVTLTAKNAKTLFYQAQALLPMLATIEIPDDGSAFEIPVPVALPNQQKVMAYAKDNHLVVYTGDKANQYAQQLVDTELKPSASFFQILMNYAQFNHLLDKLAQISGKQDPDTQKILGVLKNANMVIKESIEVSSDGLLMKVKMTGIKKKSS